MSPSGPFRRMGADAALTHRGSNPKGSPIQLTQNMEPKWVITSEEDSPTHWDDSYKQHGYSNILSLTPDPETRRKLLGFVPKDSRSVLIPGCGSETHLQRQLCSEFQGLEEVVCTDWAQTAIDLAGKSFLDPKVSYVVSDTAALPFEEGRFDAIIVVNSIVSPQDTSNRAMIKDCFRVLRPGGRFIGIFPTLFCALEVSYLEPEFAGLRSPNTLSLEKSSYWENSQNTWQIFYSPLRLNRILREAGFTREHFEVFFFDSSFALKETERIYGFAPDSNLCVWELLTVFQKPVR